MIRSTLDIKLGSLSGLLQESVFIDKQHLTHRSQPVFDQSLSSFSVWQVILGHQRELRAVGWNPYRFIIWVRLKKDWQLVHVLPTCGWRTYFWHRRMQVAESIVQCITLIAWCVPCLYSWLFFFSVVCIEYWIVNTDSGFWFFFPCFALFYWQICSTEFFFHRPTWSLFLMSIMFCIFHQRSPFFFFFQAMQANNCYELTCFLLQYSELQCSKF